MEPKHKAWELHERPNTIFFCLASNFWRWKLEAKNTLYAIGRSSRVCNHAKHNKFAFILQFFVPKLKVECKTICLDVSWNSQTWSSKVSKEAKKFFYLDWALNKPKKIQEKKMTQKLKAKKHKANNLREKELKNMKLEKLGSLPQVVVLFVCPLPPTRTRTQWIYTWESQAKN